MKPENSPDSPENKGLKKADNHIMTVLDAVQNGVFIVDPRTGAVADVNQSACRMIGASKEEVIGQTWRQFISSNGKENDPAADEKRTADYAECTLHQADGENMPVLNKSEPIILSGRRYTVVSLTDISALKKTEETALQEAALAERIKAEFMSNMSHEIRTPLNGIIGMTGLLLSMDLKEEEREFAETIRKSSDGLMAVVNDILDFSKMEAGKLDLDLMDFDLRVMLEELNRILNYKTQNKQLKYSCVVHHDVPSLLHGDPGRLRQILFKLADNAIKFTHEGEVAVRVTCIEETAAAAAVKFTVTDTGIGIPEDRRKRLFEPFTQVDGSKTRRYGGTGLGLSIVKHLVKLMDGGIDFESEPDRGSRFWFTAVFKKQLLQMKPALSEKNIRGKHILIADENSTNRQVLREQLKNWGCPSDEAVSGADALSQLYQAKFEGNPFDIAILDRQLPVMDGELLGKKIKSDPDIKQIILILLTSVGKRGDAARFEEIGFSAYLTRPVKQSHIHHCLSLVLSADDTKETEEVFQRKIITRHSLMETQKQFAPILLADEDADHRRDLAAVLRKSGCSLDEAENSSAALNALQEKTYCLAVMDVLNPEIDGFETVSAIRKNESGCFNANMPIVAMIPPDIEAGREKCIQAGMNDVMTKPVDPAVLIQKIEHWTSRGRKAGQYSVPPASNALHVAENRLKVIDFTEALERAMGDKEFLILLLREFSESLSVTMNEIRSECQAGRYNEVAKRAHKVKGTASNLNAERLSEAALVLESAARKASKEKGKHLDTKKAVDHMTAEVTIFQQFIDQEKWEQHQ